MRAPLATVAALLVGAAPAAGALPGWTIGSVTFAGNDLVASQSGPVRSGRLVYYRTDVWRVPILRAGRTAPERRVITVRTSIGPTSIAPLAGGASGAFALIADGPDFTPPVIWCCDRKTGLQSVLESDGSPGARVPLAVGLSGANVRYLARDGDTSVVATVDPATGSRTEIPVPGRPAGGISAISGDTLAWVDSPPYDRGRTVRRGRVGVRAVTSLGSFRPPGTVISLATLDGTIVALTLQDSEWKVIRASGIGGAARIVWTGRARPVVATGDGVVAVGVGREIRVGRGTKLRVVARLARPARALAVNGRRVAWLDWARVAGRKKTLVRWLQLP